MAVQEFCGACDILIGTRYKRLGIRDILLHHADAKTKRFASIMAVKTM